MLNIPSRGTAETLLDEAGLLNPGPWVAHSRHVAQAAELIAAASAASDPAATTRHPQLDPEAAYILGCLHDIGRREGRTGMRHVIDGYQFLTSLGYDDAARACLTHSYPTKDAATGSDRWDGTPEEYDFVQAYLDGITYTPYDSLIQLCDTLALPSGFCLMEVRFVDVVMRYGFNDHTLRKWQAFFQIKEDFERVIQRSIYSVLPGVIENTFAATRAGAGQG